MHLDDRPGWAAPVHTAIAAEDRGVDETLASLRAHLAWCVGDGHAGWQERRADGRVRTFLDLVGEDAREDARRAAGPLLDELRAARIRPERAAERWRGRWST